MKRTELRTLITLEEAPSFDSKEEAEKFYLDFLKNVKEKPYNENLKLEKHHVIPKHEGGPNTQDNLILVSIEDLDTNVSGFYKTMCCYTIIDFLHMVKRVIV